LKSGGGIFGTSQKKQGACCGSVVRYVSFITGFVEQRLLLPAQCADNGMIQWRTAAFADAVLSL
jgi:hypothetical protein